MIMSCSSAHLFKYILSKQSQMSSVSWPRKIYLQISRWYIPYRWVNVVCLASSLLTPKRKAERVPSYKSIPQTQVRVRFEFTTWKFAALINVLLPEQPYHKHAYDIKAILCKYLPYSKIYNSLLKLYIRLNLVILYFKLIKTMTLVSAKEKDITICEYFNYSNTEIQVPISNKASWWILGSTLGTE